MWSLSDGRLLWWRTDVPTSFLAVSPDGTRLATSGFRQDPTDRNADGKSIATRFTLWDLKTRTALVSGRFPRRRQLRRGCAARSTQASGAVVLPGLDGLSLRASSATRGSRPSSTTQPAATASRPSLSAADSLTFTPDSSELLDPGRRRGGHRLQPAYGAGRSSISLHRPAVTASLLFSADGQWLVGSYNHGPGCLGRARARPGPGPVAPAVLTTRTPHCPWPRRRTTGCSSPRRPPSSTSTSTRRTGPGSPATSQVGP